MKTVQNGFAGWVGSFGFCLSHVQSLPASEKSQRNLLCKTIHVLESIYTYLDWMDYFSNQSIFVLYDTTFYSPLIESVRVLVFIDRFKHGILLNIRI